MIFVDTGAWLARFLSRDQYHSQAMLQWGILEQTGETLVTSDSVFAETLSFLCRRAHPMAAGEAGKFMHGWEDLKIIRASREDEAAALGILRKYGDQGIGFVDCLSFALMDRYRIKTAFTFDRNFEMAGFKLLP